LPLWISSTFVCTKSDEKQRLYWNKSTLLHHKEITKVWIHQFL
jgi:hypothetical protein